MLVYDVLLNIRSRLNDTDDTKYRWSDEELVDAINSSLSKISTALHIYTNTHIEKIVANQNRYKLPFNVVKVLSVDVGGYPATIKSLEWMEQNKNYIDDDNFFVCFDRESFSLYPIKLLEVDMEVSVRYSYVGKVYRLEDEIGLSDIFKDAIVFYAMHLALQVNTSEKNQNKSVYYLNLFNGEMMTLKSTVYGNKHSRNIVSKYKKV